MNAFFVAFVVFGFVVLTTQTTCYFPNEGDGGVLDGDNYIPDSVLVWCDVANNTRAYADDIAIPNIGKQNLDYWDIASRCFNDCMPSGNLACAAKMLAQANYSFCKIFPHIINNKPLADFFEKVCNEFTVLLNAGNFEDIDDYMVEAYPTFNGLMCY